MSDIIAALAGEAYDAFEHKTRDNGDAFTCLKDDAPEWVHDLVREAHGDMFPDDWRYAAIRSALGAIHDAEPSDLDDYASEWADSNVDTYNGSRAHWLASNLSRAGYVDEAVEDFGHHEYGVYGDIGLGQYRESEEIFQSIAQSLTERMGDIS